MDKARRALDILLTKAQSTLRALNIEANDESIEASSPIRLPEGSLGAAVFALPKGGEAA
jgi:hypothetical protein